MTCRAVVAALLAGAVLRPSAARAQVAEDFFHGMPTSPPPAEPAPPPATPLPTPPEAQAAPFGSRGQWVVGGSSSAGVSSQSFSKSSAVFTSATFDPTVDWFIARNVSLGLRTGVSYSDNKGYGADGSLVDTKFTALRIGPRVGVNVPLGRAFSLWPTAAVGFEWVSETQTVVSGTSTSVSGNPSGYPSSTELGPWVVLDVALLWHVAPHFYVGVVPGVFHGFGHVQGGPEVGGQETEVSGGFVVGGWFGGPRDSPAPDAPPPEPGTRRRFGQEGELALSNELSLDGHWTGYAGTPSSSWGSGFTLGFDYFVADHFSLGLALTGSVGATTGIDSSTGATVTSQSSDLGGAIRAGVDIPAGDVVSVWPRASLSLGTQTVSEQEGATNKNVSSITSVSLYVPVLAHPGTHFFVGFGPSVSRDLSRAISVNGADGVPNPSTTLGAGMMIGGWL